jgi:cytochrome c-type biogenesis protein
MFDLGHGGAFLAGLASFLSPCILPLVPPYLCWLAGIGISELAGAGAKDPALTRRVVLRAFAFVLGFAAVFVALGASATMIGRFVGDHLGLFTRIAGTVIIVFGLHFLGVLRISLLYREARISVERRPAGMLGAFGLGLAFAFGWTPCVGPVLTAILLLAGAESSALTGASLLAAYAGGIALPFLAAAIFVEPFLRFLARFRPWLGWMEKAVGAALVATGVLILTGTMARLANWLYETFPIFARIG